jgi:uncharacterized protein (TIGR02147 family)
MKNDYVDICAFKDFRKYLKSYQKNRIKVDPKFNGSYICAKLGIPKTRGFFNDVIKGKNLSIKVTEKMIKIFELSEHEANYFRLMVHLDRAIARGEKIFIKKQLELLKKGKSRRAR